MLELLDVHKSFKDKNVLNGISYEFPDSGFYILKGKNGAGKTTLLNIISGLDSSFTGSLVFDGKAILKNNAEEYHESYTGTVFQFPYLMDDMKVIDNLLFPYEEKDKQKGLSVLKKVGLNDNSEEMVGELSAGEKQRLMIAIAIYKPKRILLCDEITSNLDDENTKGVINLLKDISKTSLVILSTHDDLKALGFSSLNYLVLNKGTIKAEEKDNSSKANEKTLEAESSIHSTSAFQILIGMLKRQKIPFIVFGLFISLIFILAFSFMNISTTAKTQEEYTKGYMIENYPLIHPYKNEDFDSQIDYDLDNLPSEDKVYAHYCPIVYSGNISDVQSADDWSKYTDIGFSPATNDYALTCGDYPQNDDEIVISEFGYAEMRKNDASLGDFDHFTAFSYDNDWYHNPLKITGVYTPKIKNQEVLKFEEKKSGDYSISFGSYAPYRKAGLVETDDPLFYKTDDLSISMLSGYYFNTLVFVTSEAESFMSGKIDSVSKNGTNEYITLCNYTRGIGYGLYALGLIVPIIFLNYLYLAEKDRMIYLRITCVSRKRCLNCLLLLCGLSFLVCFGLSWIFAPIGNMVFMSIINGFTYGAIPYMVGYSVYSSLYISGVFLIGCIFVLIRFHSALTKNMGKVLAKKNNADI